MNRNDAEERAEAEENSKAARVWISGLETFAGITGIEAIYDYPPRHSFSVAPAIRKDNCFPRVVSDFGLMDAIESGIVKVPRLPVVDDAIKGDLPKFRDVYNVIREENPRAFPDEGRRTGGAAADPSKLPHHLLEAAHRRALQTLRRSVQQVGGAAGAWPAAGVHRRLQQHRHIEKPILSLDFRLRNRGPPP